MTVHAGFASALRPGATGAHWLVHGDGGRSPLQVRRWHGAAEPALRAVVRRCAGPTLDLGCGPGRLALALRHAGIAAVGVDVSAEAVSAARSRGAVVLHQDLFDPLPGEGHWAHAVLLDGNIGIGGDPVALLRRCRRLIDRAGTVLVELEPPGPGLWRGSARVASARRPGLGPVFPWARLDTEAVTPVAAEAGLVVAGIATLAPGRWIAELRRRQP